MSTNKSIFNPNFIDKHPKHLLQPYSQFYHALPNKNTEAQINPNLSYITRDIHVALSQKKTWHPTNYYYSYCYNH